MALQDTDTFLVNRNNTSYQVEAQNLMSIQDSDLMLVNRNNTSYKITGSEVKDALGGALPKFSINDGFRMTRYTGNASTRTFFSDLGDCRSGCFVWIRTVNMRGAYFFSPTWGDDKMHDSKSGSANPVDYAGTVGFTSSGIRVGSSTNINSNGTEYIIYVWKKTPGLFDMVTYTGNNSSGRAIAHNLGCKPSMIWVYPHNTTSYGFVHYFTHTAPNVLYYASSGAGSNADQAWGRKEATETEFYVGNSGNTNGGTYTFTAFIWGGSEDDPEYPIKTGTYAGNDATTAYTIDTGSPKAPQLFMIKSIFSGQNKEPVFHDTAQGLTGSQAYSWHLSNYAGLYLPGAVDFSTPGEVTVTTRDANINPSPVNTVPGIYAYMYIDEP